MAIQSFLGVFELETGGIVIGGFYLLYDFFCAICAFFMAIFGHYYCGQIEQLLRQMIGQKVDLSCTIRALVLAFVVTPIYVFFSFVHFVLIKAIEQRDPIKTKAVLIFYAIFNVLLCFAFFLCDFFLEYFLVFLILVVNIYWLVVIYAIWDKFKNPKSTQSNDFV